jgi:hypothetical protein
MDTVSLLTLDEVVGAEVGLVYSTQPKRAQGPGQADYFVKGPSPEVVFPELAGCLLAKAAGIPVPTVAACTFQGEVFAGSLKVADIGRNVLPWLNAERARNFGVLYEVIVVDTWLANEDRNPGNVLGAPAGKGIVSLVMIDFEKSAALRPNPITTSPTIAPQKLWPRGELGQFLRTRKALHPPTGAIQRVRALADKPDEIRAVMSEVTASIGPISWSENSVEALLWRASRISDLVGEVWATT